MRKIKKDLTLATAYKIWLEEFTNDNKDHPPYDSSGNSFYYDIVANLFWVQQGLCAYTETFLISTVDVESTKWVDGKINKFIFLGELDHYDAALKSKKGWEWDNLFMIHNTVNRQKGQRKTNNILKPDKDDYAPFHFLEYNIKEHYFTANSTLEFELQEKITQDINVLGLNLKPIVDERKLYLTPIIEDIRFEKKTVLEAKKILYQFYTAFEMSVIDLKL